MLLLAVLLPAVCFAATNTPDGRPTVVLSTARHDDPYYNKTYPGETKSKYQVIIDFHTQFAKKILAAGDNVIVACDPVTCEKLKANLPADILWDAGFDGIWMRDLSRVSMPRQVGFMYINDYMYEDRSLKYQRAFDRAFESIPGLHFKRRLNIALDGGNVVDNFRDMGIITERVYRDNYADSHRRKRRLHCEIEDALNYDIAMIPELEEDTTGHADGVVSFIDDYVVALSEVGDDILTLDGRPGQTAIYNAVHDAFGGSVKYVKLPYVYPNSTSAFNNFTSSCGTHVNALLTKNNLFVPTFTGDPANVEDGITKDNETKVLGYIKSNVTEDRNVVEVPVPKSVCEMGGSVRCLSYVLDGRNANRLVNYVANGGDPEGQYSQQLA